MKKVIILITLLIFTVLLFSFAFFPIKGARISAKVPIDDATYITIRKMSEDTTSLLPVAQCTIPDEKLQEFILHFEDTALQSLYNLPFAIESEIRYYVSIETSDDSIWIDMKFYHDDAVIIDCVYGDRQAFHGRYSITRTNLIAFFDAMLQEYSEIKGG